MNLDKEDLISAIDEALNSRRSIDEDTHRTHHTFVQHLIEKSEQRQKLITKFKLSLVGTLATTLVGLLIWIGKLIWEHFPRNY